jgi:CheY-like chemotaxis protein
MVRTLGRILRDYDVVALVNPREAWARLASGERFDVILCDLMMAQMTGAAFYDRVTRLSPDQAERMIFITAGAITPETEAFLARVAVPVLPKPFDSTALRTLIQRYLRSP